MAWQAAFLFHPTPSHPIPAHPIPRHLVPAHRRELSLTRSSSTRVATCTPSPDLTSCASRSARQLITSHLISSPLVSSHLLPSPLVSSHLLSSDAFGDHRGQEERNTSHPVPSRSHPIPSHLISSHPISSHLIPPHPTSSHLIPPHPTSSHLIPTHLLSRAGGALPAAGRAHTQVRGRGAWLASRRCGEGRDVSWT
jgi:hypothetical protein